MKIKKSEKNFKERFYSKAKIFRKNFLIWQRSRWLPNRGGVPSANKATQYRRVTDLLHVYCARDTRVSVRWSPWLLFLRLFGRLSSRFKRVFLAAYIFKHH